MKPQKTFSNIECIVQVFMRQHFLLASVYIHVSQTVTDLTIISNDDVRKSNYLILEEVIHDFYMEAEVL